MQTIGLLTLSQVLLAVAISSAEPAPEPRPAPRERTWRLSGGIDQKYDDNILFLSDGSIRQFKSGSAPQQFRIKRVDDQVSVPWTELRTQRGQAEFGIGARLNFYANNSVKNYEQFHAYLGHRNGTKSSLRFTYRWLHGGYAGELTDPDTGSPASVFYDVHELEVRYRYRCSPTVTIAPELAPRLRVYNGTLDDARTRAGVDAKFPTYVRAAPWLRLDFDVDLEYLRALSPRDNYDPSAFRYYFEVGTLIEPVGTELDLSPSIRYGQRRFTTSGSGSGNSTFSGRVDNLYQLQLEAEYHFSTGVSLRGAYEHNGVKAGVLTLLDENTSFRRNVYTAGLTLRY